MLVSLTDAQREAPVDATRMARFARGAVRRLGIRTPGRLAITFIGSRELRALNKRFMRHDRMTDVLSFRYDPPTLKLRRAGGEHVIGEILVAPAQARAYAKRHGIPYREELSRYVVHGLLHWLGHEDRTGAQQRKMRAMEDRLLNGASR